MRTLIRIALAISLLASLAAGPAASAAPPPDMGVSTVGMAMSGDMDCCPKKLPAPRCPKCPLMALCASSLVALDHSDLRLPSMIASVSRADTPADEASILGRDPLPLPEPPRRRV